MKAKIVWFSGSKKVVAIIRHKGFECIGVAKCSPEDTFVLETGAKLASMRAELKLHRKMAKAYDKLSNMTWRKSMVYDGKHIECLRKEHMLQQELFNITHQQ